MAALDDTLAKINTTLDALLEKLGGRIPGDTVDGKQKDAAGNVTGQLAPVELFKKAGDELGKLAINVAGVDAVFKVISGSKDPIMDVFKDLARLQGKISTTGVQIIDNAIQPNRTATASGKDTDFVKQGEQERGTTVTYADLQKMISQNQPGMTGAGSIQNDRVDNLYSTLQKLIAENRGAIASGATTQQDLAKALILSQQRSRNDLGTNAGQAKAVEAATEYAKSIDSVAKITGESRDVIGENNSKFLKQGQEQALLASMTTQQQRDAYVKAQNANQAQGRDFQQLASEYTRVGGAVSAGAQAEQTAIGPKAAMELREAMLGLKNATTEKSRQDAEAKLQQARNSATEFQNDPQTQKMAMLGDLLDEPILKQMGKRFEENKEGAGYQYGRNQGLTPGQAGGAVNDQVGNLQDGRQQTGGARTPAMQLQQEMISGNTEIARRAGEVYRDFNIELGKNTNIVDTIVKGIQAGQTAVQKNTETTANNTGKTVTETANPDLGPPKSKTDAVPKKELGTLGTTGSTFEPKDMIALLHKGERVLSPSENTDLTNLFGMVSDLKPKSNLGGALSNIKPPAGDTAEVAEEATDKSSGDAVADSSGITLKDLNDSLQQLNSNIELMVSHTADMKDSTRETADMSGKMTGNRFAV
jgi:hypothetical protein